MKAIVALLGVMATGCSESGASANANQRAYPTEAPGPSARHAQLPAKPNTIPGDLFPARSTLVQASGNDATYRSALSVSDVEAFYRTLAKMRRYKIVSDIVPKQPSHRHPIFPDRELTLSGRNHRFFVTLYSVPSGTRGHIKRTL